MFQALYTYRAGLIVIIMSGLALLQEMIFNVTWPSTCPQNRKSTKPALQTGCACDISPAEIHSQ
jgi:hypothetical protein